jgi:hypothetical protein
MQNVLNDIKIKALKLYKILNKLFKMLEKIAIKKHFNNKNKIKKIIFLLSNYKIISKFLNNNFKDNIFKWKFLIFFSEIFFLYKNILLQNNIKNQIIVLKNITNIYFKINNNKNISGFIIDAKKKSFYSFLIDKHIFNNKEIIREFWRLINILSDRKKLKILN